MAYQLSPGDTRRVLDQNGNQIPEGFLAAHHIDDTTVVALAGAAGMLYLLGIGVGETDVSFTPPGGLPVVHRVTVVPTPFDWTLGEVVTL